MSRERDTFPFEWIERDPYEWELRWGGFEMGRAREVMVVWKKEGTRQFYWITRGNAPFGFPGGEMPPANFASMEEAKAGLEAYVCRCLERAGYAVEKADPREEDPCRS